MLYKFFIAQWNNPVKSDWTLEAKSNLVEFGMKTSLEEIETMSKNSFKNLVQKKAKEYEFLRFLEIKMSKSKMKDLSYTHLKIQDYLLLKNMNLDEAKALFKFRVRMSPFGENYRGGRERKICPFCKNHPDGLSRNEKVDGYKRELQSDFWLDFSQ